MSRRRRGRGEGAIYHRNDGQWCASITVGYDENGKRRRRTVYGTTKKAVQDRLVELQSNTFAGALLEPSTVTVAEASKHWLETVARRKVRPKTYQLYESLIRLHINPRIGGIRLNKLTAIQLQGLYADMERDRCSPRMQQLVHARVFSILKQAARWRLIQHNIALDVDRPTAPTKRFEVLNPEQAWRFLVAAREDRLHALYVLALLTGLRQGELFGLQVDDVDLASGTLFIRHQLQELAGKLDLTEPKTAAGRRRITLPKMAVEALAAHLERMREEGWTGPWVFCDTKGGPLRKSNVRRKSFYPLLDKAGVPQIRFHDLRHSAATLLLREDVHPKVVQEMLGHSRIGITLDTYSHAVPSMQRDAAAKLDHLFEAVARKEKQDAEPSQDVIDEDWLQSGYKIDKGGFAEDADDDANTPEFLEEEEWSHVDSNHGPPACEAGALTN